MLQQYRLTSDLLVMFIFSIFTGFITWATPINAFITAAVAILSHSSAREPCII